MIYAYQQVPLRNYFPVDFKTWLDTELESRKLSARRVALAAGFTPAHLSRLRNGKVGATPESVEKIADAIAEESERLTDRQQIRDAAMAAFAGLEPEIEREVWHEDTLEVAHFYNGIADPRMRERVKRIMMSAVEIFDEEPEDAGPSGNRTD